MRALFKTYYSASSDSIPICVEEIIGLDNILKAADNMVADYDLGKGVYTRQELVIIKNPITSWFKKVWRFFL